MLEWLPRIGSGAARGSSAYFGVIRTPVSAAIRTVASVLIRTGFAGSEIGVRNGPKRPPRSGVTLDKLPEVCRLRTRRHIHGPKTSTYASTRPDWRGQRAAIEASQETRKRRVNKEEVESRVPLGGSFGSTVCYPVFYCSRCRRKNSCGCVMFTDTEFVTPAALTGELVCQVVRFVELSR